MVGDPAPHRAVFRIGGSRSAKPLKPVFFKSHVVVKEHRPRGRLHFRQGKKPVTGSGSAHIRGKADQRKRSAPFVFLGKQHLQAVVGASIVQHKHRSAFNIRGAQAFKGLEKSVPLVPGIKQNRRRSLFFKTAFRAGGVKQIEQGQNKVRMPAALGPRPAEQLRVEIRGPFLLNQFQMRAGFPQTEQGRLQGLKQAFRIFRAVGNGLFRLKPFP